MYCPKFNKQDNLKLLQQFVSDRSFGHWSCMTATGIEVNSLPFFLDCNLSEKGTLLGHVARLNPIWQNASSEQESVIVFEGADAYVSPSFYPTKKEHGKVVPTWNYRLVQIRGRVRFIEDRDWLRKHLLDLTQAKEQGQTFPWAIEDAPPSFIEKLLGAIVGVEIPIDRIEGKWKLGQNRMVEDREGIIKGLNERSSNGVHPLSSALVKYMESEQA